MKVVKAAAVQLSPVLYSREGTIEKIVGKILELGQQGVKFVTFPETRGALLPVFLFHPGRLSDPFRMRVGRRALRAAQLFQKSILSPRTNTKIRYATPRHLQIGLDQPRKPFPRTRLNLLCFDGRLVTTAASSGRHACQTPKHSTAKYQKMNKELLP